MDMFKHGKRYGNKFYCKYCKRMCGKGIFNGCTKKKTLEKSEGIRSY